MHSKISGINAGKNVEKFHPSQGSWRDKLLQQPLSMIDSSQAWHISAISNCQEDI